MSAHRLDMHRLQEFVRLHRLGLSSRDIARLLKMGRNTQRQYRRCLSDAGLLDGDPDQIPDLADLKVAVREELPPTLPQQQVSTIENWRSSIAEMIERGAGPTAIYDKLRFDDPTFRASVSAVKRLYARILKEKGVQPQDVAIPVISNPGEIAQVDFGYLGKLLDSETGTVRKVWVFVLVLAYSRHMVARLVFGQSAEIWQQLHVEAFTELGGVTDTIVPDNLKAAVIRASFAVDEQSQLNRSYRELARHYGCKIDPTPVRAPEKKGKVESAVKYIKTNFWKPRAFRDVEHARQELARWVPEIAGTRRHGTTGKQPLEVFRNAEKPLLKPLPQKPYELVSWRHLTVHQDTHVLFEQRLYSVPWSLLGQKVWVRATRGTVAIYHDDERVATHDRTGPGIRITNEAHLPTHRADLRHRSPAHWLERADAIDPAVGTFAREVFAADNELSQLKVVQAIVRLLETVPQQRAKAACARASHFAAFSFQALKRILDRGLDREPLHDVVPFPAPTGARPRFARPLADIIHLKGGQP